MAQEEKQLSLADLCARLPYGVIVETQFVNTPRANHSVRRVLKGLILSDYMQTIGIVIHKPYLRSMSSMTAEEMEELKQVALVDNEGVPGDIPAYIDWLNKKMFDYRGLIPMGLANEAPEGMYK